MKLFHKVGLVLTTFIMAAATGHVMQNANNSQRLATVSPAGLDALGLRNIEPVANLQSGTQPALLATQLPQIAVPAMRRPQPVAELALPPEPPQEGLGFVHANCPAPQFDAQAGPAASVRLGISAPCLGTGLATIHHQGVALPVTLTAQGTWTGLVPALAEQAEFTVELANGQSLSVVQMVPDLLGVNRVVLLSDGAIPLSLHDLDNDVGEGTKNALAPRGPDTPLAGWKPVFDTAVGTQQVQIFDGPAMANDANLMIEALVTADSCGQNVSLRVARVMRGHGEAPVEISLAMPPCDGAAGAVLMPLPNSTMTLAQN